jgi:hypothetical protein
MPLINQEDEKVQKFVAPKGGLYKRAFRTEDGKIQEGDFVIYETTQELEAAMAEKAADGKPVNFKTPHESIAAFHEAAAHDNFKVTAKDAAEKAAKEKKEKLKVAAAELDQSKAQATEV